MSTLQSKDNDEKITKKISQFKADFDSITSAAEKREATREYVTKNIINMYAFCILAIVAVSLLCILFDKYQAFEFLGSIVQYVNALVLPIITLVLGFYFGSQKE